MPLLLPALLCLCSPLQQTVPVEQVWEEFTLDNGIRVVLVDAPLATSQVVFTLLPWGLLDDEAGQVQRSHLAEHILVHSADPEAGRPDVGGVLRNGETMAISMRLETFAEPAVWRAGLERHARWLMVSQADAELLARILPRERSAMASEVINTSASGFTHKWALAAWNQVVRHGADDISLRDDVATVEWDALFASLCRRVRSGRGVRIVSVGPVDRKLQKAAFRELFGGLPARPWQPSVASLPAARVRAAADRQATWDLERIQYMVWYPVPDESAVDRVAADALAAVVNARLRQRGKLLEMGVQAFASADLITPEGRWLLISASLPPDLEVATVAGVVADVVEQLDRQPEARLVIEEMARQLGTWPDFAALRKEAAGHPDLRWIEASQALFMVYAQVNMGLDLNELKRAYEDLDETVVETMATTWLTPALRSTLTLRPRS